MSRERVDLTSLMCDIAADPVDDGPELAPEPEWMPPEPEPEPEKYGQDRRRQILMIQMYLNEFPEKLSQYKKTDLESLTNDELAKLLEEIKYLIGAKGNVSAAVRGMLMGLGALENIATTFTPAKIGGLTQTISADKDAMDDMKAIALKHVDMVAVEPEVRLAMRILSTAMMMHAVNSQQEAIAAANSGKNKEQSQELADPPGIVEPATPEKYAGL